MLQGDPLSQVLHRAREVGIQRLVSVSVDEASWELNQKVANSDPEVFFTLGIHPHDAKDYSGCEEKMRSLYRGLKEPKKCVGIGETGLDFYYNKSTREEQIAALESQLRLAKELNLPVVFHCRDAFDELYNAIRRVGLSSKAGVMHCFTGDEARAREAIDLGLFISFSGILTFKNADAIQGAARAIPLEKIVLETDCPFLAPVPLRGKPNEPSFLVHTGRMVAMLRKMSEDEVARATTENACRLFGWALT